MMSAVPTKPSTPENDDTDFVFRPANDEEVAVVNRSKRKGDAAERELAKQLSDLLGFTVRRKLGAGRQDDEGDLDGLPDCTAQAKNWRDVLAAIREGLRNVAVQQANANTKHGVLFIRRHGGEWVAVMSLEAWATLYRESL